MTSTQPKSLARRRPRPLSWLVPVVLLAIGVVLAAQQFSPVSSAPRPTEVLVPRGASIARIGRILAAKRLIRSATAFRLAARVRGSFDVKAGIYTLSPSMSTGQILDALKKGAPEELVRLTFPEGFTLEQVAERVAELKSVRADEFQRLAMMRGRTFSASFRPPDNLEGYLYPDTYDFRPDATERDVIETMLETFDRKVVQELSADFAASAKRGYDLYQIVTLASLVEREARVKKDQPLIAAVLYNRLKIGMPLQIDATVQYVIGHRERLLYRDLEVDSPYNTYKIVGLPPGPICNPGIDAIRAALHPADADYLYYTARPDGTHTFTKTLDAHVKATEEARAERGG